ncbi:nuclear transport factor 2 family protein [Streptomyces acidiscabies]|uniref:nuclear transport factor 2 family protein n=1 Tax=Streptomyces acidiscabies TaxID=42234 RepID=UPI00099C4314|nr:nuclear transport factor 2 family protein [Streptomyces acidiscabies]
MAPGHDRDATRRRFLIGTGAATAALGLAHAAPAIAEPASVSTPEAVDPAVSVVAVRAIKQLKARYFQSIDTKNWALLRQQLTDDVAVDTTGSFGPKMTGADAFIGFLKLTIGSAETVHHGHMPEITVTSPTSATGVWALQDLLIWLGVVRVIGFGHYHEEYTLVDGRWRISSTKLTRVYMDPLTAQRLFGM